MQLHGIGVEGLVHNGEHLGAPGGVHRVHHRLHRFHLRLSAAVVAENVVINLQGGQTAVVPVGDGVSHRGGEKLTDAGDFRPARGAVALLVLNEVVLGLEGEQLRHGLQVIGALDVLNADGLSGAQVVGNAVGLGVVGEEQGLDHRIVHGRTLGGNAVQRGGGGDVKPGSVGQLGLIVNAVLPRLVG
ncbi:hypothetical protein SDC9_97884 [bioreactor metagenome]|uniref:Uncharacterized protein n=1 Tax=bioreactor metagenome TaxID=1076179 RepID=A0A645ADN3_9ZZZZ